MKFPIQAWLPVSILITATLAPINTASAEILRRDYQGFTLWIDCDRRGVVRYQYNVQRDTGNNARSNSFYLDPKIPKRCQQKSTATYKAKGQRYHRGHQVTANHLDYSPIAIRQTNFMVNILPQAANMNTGAWKRTEEIIECHRDRYELLVVGGVIWGNDRSNDHFVRSHGVATPDAYWKVVIKWNGVIAWIVPNTQQATKKRLDKYLVSIAELEKRARASIPVPADLKHSRPARSWGIPKGCDFS